MSGLDKLLDETSRLDRLMAETETPPSDSWSYVLAAHGDIRETIPPMERKAYDDVISTVEDPKGFEDQMTASLFLDSVLGTGRDFAYDNQTALTRQLFKEPLSPSAMVQRALKNEETIQRWATAWNGLIWRQRAEKEAPAFWQQQVNQTASGLGMVASAGATGIQMFLEEEPTGTPYGFGFEFQRKRVPTEESAYWAKQGQLLWEIGKHPDLAMKRDDWLSQLLGLGSQTVPYITATTAATILTGPMGGFAVGWMVEGNSAYRTALDEGVPEEQARKIGMAVGMVSGAIESFGFKWSDRLMAEATKKIKSKLLAGAVDLTVGSITEALEEAGQEIAQITGESIYKDTDWNEAVRRTLAAAGGGFAVGGMFKLASASVRGVTAESSIAEQKQALRVLAAQGELSEQVVEELEQALAEQEAKDEAGREQGAAPAMAPGAEAAAPAGAAAEQGAVPGEAGKAPSRLGAVFDEVLDVPGGTLDALTDEQQRGLAADLLDVMRQADEAWEQGAPELRALYETTKDPAGPTSGQIAQEWLKAHPEQRQALLEKHGLAKAAEARTAGELVIETPEQAAAAKTTAQDILGISEDQVTPELAEDAWSLYMEAERVYFEGGPEFAGFEGRTPTLGEAARAYAEAHPEKVQGLLEKHGLTAPAAKQAVPTGRQAAKPAEGKLATPTADEQVWEMTQEEVRSGMPSWAQNDAIQEEMEEHHNAVKWAVEHAGEKDLSGRLIQVPRAVLEEYKGEPWADAALAKLSEAKVATTETVAEKIKRLSREFDAAMARKDIDAMRRIVPQIPMSEAWEKAADAFNDFVRTQGGEATLPATEIGPTAKEGGQPATAAKPQTGPAQPATAGKPATMTAGKPEAAEAKVEPKRKVSRAAERIQEEAVAKDLTDSLGELPTYEKMDMKEQARMAADEIAKDYENAKQMAYGKVAPPKGLRPASIYRAVAVKARTEGDVETLRNLAVVYPQISLELTAMGQAIKAADVGRLADPVVAMQDIQKTKEKIAAKRRKVTDMKKETARQAKEAKAEIAKKVNHRQSWSEFVESIRC